MKLLVTLTALALLPLSLSAADVTGTWKSEFDSQIGVQNYTYVLKQDGTTVTGTASTETNGQPRETELKDGKIEGDSISFVEILDFQGNEIPITYTGTVAGDEMKLTREVGEFAIEEIVATRESTPAFEPVRIKAGSFDAVVDADGNEWMADQGFDGGMTIERPDIEIENTESPVLYQAERYSMNSFSWPVPNGNYLVKLHFAETFDGIFGPGDRVFSFNVEGKEFNDFDVWEKAGGYLKAYVETVPVEVTDGTIDVTFTPNIENPQINAIEILPAPAAKTVRIKAGSFDAVVDADGNEWMADQGFDGGMTIERPDIEIENTESPVLYQAERYSMNSFSWPVPNGNYLVKLHFAETFDGIFGPGERVFSFNVEGKEFNDFDVWEKAGGYLKAYVESVPVEVTDGTIDVTFTPNIENPQINAIELIPQP